MKHPRRGLPCQRRATLRLAAALSLTAMACSGTPAVRPDILLVTLDTVRADRLGTFGGDPLISPNLDRLARRGRAFSSCDAASPLTLPSHATILTGLYPPSHGLRSNGRGRLPAGVPTLAQQFQNHGYATAAFVSSVVLDHGHGLDGGFTTYDDQVGPAGERRGDATVDAALSWWRRPRRQPAFIWVHLFDAHAPYRPPSPWAERFPGRPYEGEIAFMDAQVGRLLDGMTAAGRDLVVAVAGDHGEGLGEHGEKEHGLLLYQSTLAVPCILVVPGLTAGGHTSRPVRTLDLMPTLLARAGIVGPEDLRGLDLLAPASEETAATVSYAETLLPWEDYGWHPLFAARRGAAKIQQGAYTTYHDLDRDSQEVEPRLPGGRMPVPAPVLAVAEELTAVIDRIRNTRPAPPPVAASPVPGATLEELRRLGYLAGSAQAPPLAMPIPGLRDPRAQTSFHSRVAVVLAAYRDGRTADAAEALGALLGEEPGNPFLRDLAGSVEMARGDPAAAADHFAAALAHTPDRGAVEIHLAEALLALGQAQEAEMRARHALTTLPEPPPVRAALTLCQAVASQGRRQEARRCAVTFLAAWERVENPLLTRLRALARGEEYP